MNMGRRVSVCSIIAALSVRSVILIRHAVVQGSLDNSVGAVLPFQLLKRIRKLIPGSGDAFFADIQRGIEDGVLKPPRAPMSDQELAAVIREFVERERSPESVRRLGASFASHRKNLSC